MLRSSSIRDQWLLRKSIFNNLNDARISTVERSVYVLEKRRLGSDFCGHCELEFKAGCEKDRKEKDVPIRNSHTFESTICDFRLKNK